MSSEIDRRAIFAGIAGATGIVGLAATASAQINKPPLLPDVPAPAVPPPIAGRAPVIIHDSDGSAYDESAASSDEALLGLAVDDAQYQEWMKLLTSFHDLYDLRETHQNDQASFRPTAFRIDSDFKYALQAAEGTFNYLHVETLLNQTSDLLDRCIQERAVFEDESSRAATLALEIEDFLHNDLIHRDEIRNGIYTLLKEIAEAEHMIVSTQIGFLEFIKSELEYVHDIINVPKQADHASTLAWLQYAFDQPQQEVKVNGSSTIRANHASSASSYLTAVAASDRRASAMAQLKEVTERLEFARQREEILKARQTWEHKDVGYKKGRYQSARKLAQLKIKLCCLKEGALNFAERRDQSKLRFARDFNDALSRYRALAKGLALLYGYTQPDPAMENVKRGEATIESLSAKPFLGRLDFCVNWIRDAVAWLIRFQASEQTYTCVVSLRGAPNGSDSWDQGIRNGGRWLIVIPESLFPEQRYVRLRGINLFAEMKRGHALWNCSLIAPRAGAIRLIDNTVNKLDQKHLPKFFFGRVTARESVRIPEDGNVAAVHNASPIGEWGLQVNAVPGQGVSFDDLQDIQIDFSVAVQVPG